MEFDIFSRMIPDPIKPLWIRGILHEEYLLKLLGSGGGGFLLGFTQSLPEVIDFFDKMGYPAIPIAE